MTPISRREFLYSAASFGAGIYASAAEPSTGASLNIDNALVLGVADERALRLFLPYKATHAIIAYEGNFYHVVTSDARVRKQWSDLDRGGTLQISGQIKGECSLNERRLLKKIIKREGLADKVIFDVQLARPQAPGSLAKR